MISRQAKCSPIEDAETARNRMLHFVNNSSGCKVGEGCQFDVQNVRLEGNKWIADYMCTVAVPSFKNGSVEIGTNGSGFKLDVAFEI